MLAVVDFPVQNFNFLFIADSSKAYIALENYFYENIDHAKRAIERLDSAGGILLLLG